MLDPRPPRLARWLIRLLVRSEAREFIEGDLLEEHRERAAAFGAGAAARWFWQQALSTILWRVVPRRGGGHAPGHGRRIDASRSASPIGALRDTGRDFRLALRGLLRAPGFSLVVVTILAVGVGATTSVYSVADWLLFRPVPGVGAPRHRLAIVQASGEDGNYTGLSYLNLRDLQAGSPAIEGMAGAASASVQVAGEGLVPVTLRAEAVTEAYFDVLEVGVHQGRLFSPEELLPGGDRVVVISHRMWARSYRRGDDVTGRVLRVNGAPYTVVGVAAPGFQGTERTAGVDLWFPAYRYGDLRHFTADYDARGRTSRPFMQSVARLAPGATPEQAEAQLREVMTRLVEAYPEENEIHRTRLPTVYPGIGVHPADRASLSRIAGVTFAVAALLLLIACANVANLLILRGTRREGAVAVRQAIGASQARIVREHLAEALILSAWSALVACGVAAGLNTLIWRGDGTFGIAAVDEASLSARVLAFALATAVTVPVLFALIPAVLAGRTDVARRIHASRPTGSARRAHMRAGLTVLQLALSLSLVVGSLLLFRTLDRLRQVDPGFDPTDLLVFTIDPEPQGYETDDAVRLHLTLLDRAREMPAVQAATLTRLEPFYASDFYGAVIRPGEDRERDRRRVQLEWIGPDYFSTLGASVRRGRSFERSEMTPGGAGSGTVVVINESLARQLFGSTDVVGRTLTVLGYRADTDRRIVGVVSDIRDDARSQAPPTLYEPFPNLAPGSYGTLLVRASGAPDRITEEIRTALAALDPDIPLARSTSVEETIAERMAEERMLGRLLGILAVLAGGLAAAGLYAVVAWTVAERTREIGIRIALGAEPGRLAAAVIRGAAGLALGGVLVGYGASILVARLLESRLFGVEPFDVVIWGLSAVVLLVVATVAAGPPAVRAAAVRPIEALRVD